MVLYPGRDIVEEIVYQRGFKLHSVLKTSSVTSIMNLVKGKFVIRFCTRYASRMANSAVACHHLPLLPLSEPGSQSIY
ncbi:hypothetical protein ABE354_22170 [Brevibacillus laterosporus]|uniref:hypothetical protein n=1 Tax=Brevibacillus laterosporus TaxID=1465 RepID=UPI003D1F0E09